MKVILVLVIAVAVQSLAFGQTKNSDLRPKHSSSAARSHGSSAVVSSSKANSSAAQLAKIEQHSIKAVSPPRQSTQSPVRHHATVGKSTLGRNKPIKFGHHGPPAKSVAKAPSKAPH